MIPFELNYKKIERVLRLKKLKIYKSCQFWPKLFSFIVKKNINRTEE